jgi:hypothetical protein
MKSRLLTVVSFALIFTAHSLATPKDEQATASKTAGPMKPPMTEPDMIKSAMSAAPPAIAQSASIVTMDEKMTMKTLRGGTNGWTCFPDMPTTPGADPMCVDKNGLEWVHAWMGRKTPPADKMGFGYMLAGGSDASNSDPFATNPAAGGRWVDTGPHVMVLNIGAKFDGYPTTAENTKVPYVMFPGTPYAHLMLPVR